MSERKKQEVQKPQEPVPAQKPADEDSKLPTKPEPKETPTKEPQPPAQKSVALASLSFTHECKISAHQESSSSQTSSQIVQHGFGHANSHFSSQRQERSRTARGSMLLEIFKYSHSTTFSLGKNQRSTTGTTPTDYRSCSLPGDNSGGGIPESNICFVDVPIAV